MMRMVVCAVWVFVVIGVEFRFASLPCLLTGGCDL